MAKGKLVLEGLIELRSPALIGCGSKERSDVDIIRDGGNNPFIPATSFVGALRHVITIEGRENELKLKQFWGFTADGKNAQEAGRPTGLSHADNAVSVAEREKISNTREERQSSLRCRDLTYKKGLVPNITIRDGIAIEAKTGIVESGKKYEYEVIEPGAQFNLHLEVSFGNDTTRDFSRSMIVTIREKLEQEAVRIGAKTNSGLGKIRLVDAKISELNFGDRRDLVHWLRKDFSNTTPLSGVKPFSLREKLFTIDATFGLKNSLIIRSYPSDPKMADAVHIQSGGIPVLPGASLKGAIRSRAERIIKTLFGAGMDKTDVNKTDKVKAFLNALFGYVDCENQTKEADKGKVSGGRKKSKEALKGRVRIDEVTLPAFAAELQTRIKIDRFTGGTIESALLETMPLFSDGDADKQIRNVKITIRDYQDAEAGLMLLVLKDLWTGDLAIGGEKGVGRGVLEGVRADVCWDNSNPSSATLVKDAMGFHISNKEPLEAFVEELKKFAEGR
ncbi:MAG: superfamily protein [Candidatus Brocadiaceae bacterium]|nr:superfamily protein [Candidatus Brocadiaceae bacterium]